MKASWLILLILLAIIVAPAYAVNINLTEKTGQNYIKWSWAVPTTPSFMVYIDGNFVFNTTNQYYYISDLMPMEEHRIDLYLYNATIAAASGLNASIDSPSTIGELQDTKTSSTTMSKSLYYLLAGLLVIFTGIAGLIQNPVKGLIFGILAIILAIILSFLSAFFMDFLVILSIILGVVAGIFTVLHAQSIMKNTYIGFRLRFW